MDSKCCCSGQQNPDNTCLDPVMKAGTVCTTLGWKDLWGGFLARWGIGRMDYIVKPGLYRVGEPGRSSPVLVTANYKMSFDHLRSRLKGINAWILVLDTRGINVWCAAGKGTFGTDELIKRVKESGLADFLETKVLVLPQLGATGVSAHTVARATGFRVVYGPVRAADIPRFLENGMKAEPAMRRVRFGFLDRFVLVPMELVSALKVLAVIIVLMFVPAWFFYPHLNRSLLVESATLGASVITGTVLFPLLLPFLPLRPFSLKAVLPAALLTAALGWAFQMRPAEIAATGLIAGPVISFIALNFTGSTTFTTLSGVRREVRMALPVYLFSLAAGIVLKFLAGFKVL